MRLDNMKISRILLAGLGLLATSMSLAFDHSHSELNSILKNHVTWNDDGRNTTVDYAGLEGDRRVLDRYLASLTSVTQSEFKLFQKRQQLAFLINAYNAYTISWVSKNYQNIDSIKDLGTLFRSPWKAKRFTLFGTQVSLDFIEHDLIREPGRFDDPRIHMAVNCASVGCPALRPEAFTADRISDQLNDSVKRFLADAERNQLNGDTWFISPIFKWYKKDFINTSGSVINWILTYLKVANNLNDKVNANDIEVKFTKYDWSLNIISPK
jgi:hypothetical protein